MSIANGIAGRRGYAPKRIMIHNDAGGKYMTAKNWESIYKSGKWDFNKGFCHYSADSNDIIQIEDDMNMAFHCGNYKYNRDALSIEVCQSMGDRDTFLANEDNVLRFMAKKCLQYGIVPSKDTIILHKQVYKTACPHRSVELHSDARQYFIDKIRKYMLNEKGAKTMECFVEKDNAIWYCNIPSGVLMCLGSKAKYNLMKEMYKANNGKDLVYYKSTTTKKYFETLKGIIKEVRKCK